MLARRVSSPLATASESMLHLEQNVRRGRRGDVVRLIQEWLCLNDFGVMIDGRFGWATEQAVKDFQGSTGVLPVTGEVDPQTYAMLIRPMTEALRMIEPPPGATLGQLVAAYALQHLRHHAREVGGQNRGPWIRLYLHGQQRPRQADLPQAAGAWCAGFVSTMVAQATATLGSEPALDYHTNCNRLAEDAIRRKRFVSGERAAADLRRVPTGSLLLLRKSGKRDEWHHAGVVTQALPKFVRTLEGNSAYTTDDEPSGHSVCRQMRSYGNLDFIVLDGK
jgi:peptidoglycan hydrolase-like protein with peptidoglycan-binding domain